MKFNIHECSGLQEYDIRMDVNARVNVNFARVGVNFQTVTV